VSRMHRAAAVGFARSADAYERGRPEYPEAAILHLRRLLPGQPLVLDLAAGTGKLTRPLLDAGLKVIAVEPVAQMRAALPAGAEALEGTAEAIPVADGSVDAVTVGQAFHWFDGEAALSEIARVLRPGGLLALLWNRRVDEDPVNIAIERLVGPYRATRPATAPATGGRPSRAAARLGRSSSMCSRTSWSRTRTGWRPAWARSASSRRWSRPSAIGFCGGPERWREAAP
jgi:SAM-dependent methyltransferase